MPCTRRCMDTTGRVRGRSIPVHYNTIIRYNALQYNKQKASYANQHEHHEPVKEVGYVRGGWKQGRDKRGLQHREGRGGTNGVFFRTCSSRWSLRCTNTARTRTRPKVLLPPTAAHRLRSPRNSRAGLLVGLCAGVPSTPTLTRSALSHAHFPFQPPIHPRQAWCLPTPAAACPRLACLPTCIHVPIASTYTL